MYIIIPATTLSSFPFEYLQKPSQLLRLFIEPKVTPDKVKYSRSSSQKEQSLRVRTDNDERQTASDEEHEDDHNVFGVHEERHGLLRSKSCPAGSPTSVNFDEFQYT